MSVFKKSIAVLFSALFLLTACGGSSKFSDADGKFAINFPVDPTVDVQTVPTDVGDLDMHVFNSELSAKKILMVAYADYPDSMIEDGKAAEVLDGVVTGAFQGFGLEDAENKTEISLGEVLGVSARGTDGYLYTVFRAYLNGNRLYQIVFISEEDYATDEEIATYMDTFEITK